MTAMRMPAQMPPFLGAADPEMPEWVQAIQREVWQKQMVEAQARREWEVALQASMYASDGGYQSPRYPHRSSDDLFVASPFIAVGAGVAVGLGGF